MKNLFKYFLFIFISYSCDSKKSYHVSDRNESDLLIFKKEVRLKIDSLTSNSSRSIKYVDVGGKEYLYQLNKVNNSIEIFNLREGEWVSRLTLDTDGPDGVGNVSYMLPISSDSILVLSDLQRLYLVDSLGKVLNKYGPFYDRNTQIGYYLLAVSEVSPVYADGKVYFATTNGYDVYQPPSITNSLSSQENILELDLETKEYRALSGYPSHLEEATGLYPDHYYTVRYIEHVKNFNDSSFFVLSYPSSETIIVTDFRTYEREVYAGSSALGNVKPLYNAKDLRKLSSEEEAKDLATTHSYQNIRYDRFRGLFYRVVELPYTDLEYMRSKDATMGIKKWGMIILDTEFNVIGEVIMNSELLAGAFLIVKEGILIYNFEKNTSSEDSLVYDLYQINFK